MLSSISKWLFIARLVYMFFIIIKFRTVSAMLRTFLAKITEKTSIIKNRRDHFLVLCLVIVTPPCWAQVNYTKTAEIPPLHVAFTSLQSILDKTDTLVSAANRDIKPRREELVLKAKDLQVNLPGNTLQPKGAKIPAQIDSLTYSYWAESPATITRVALDFGDYRRTITVEGTSPEQVDAIFATLRDELMQLSHPVGGTVLRSLLGIPANVLLFLFLGAAGADWLAKRHPGSLIVIAVIASTLLLLNILPISDLLSGFLAVPGEPSFMIRYGPQISFWAFLITVIGIPIAALPLLKKPGDKDSATEKSEQKEN